MLIIAGYIKTAPHEVEAFVAALRLLVPATLQEDGCMDYAFAIESREEGTILLYERWRDEAALAVHLSQPALGALLGDWAGRVEILGSKFDAHNQRDLM